MAAIDSTFIFSKFFSTQIGVILPLAFQDPTFANNFNTNTKTWLHVLAVGDLNGDKCDDVVLSLVDSKHNPYILISNGDGTFKVFNQFDGNAKHQFIRNGEIVDINDDGWLDFVGFESSHSGEGQTDLILINKRGYSFEVLASQTTPTQGHHSGLVSDINSDGLIDIFGIREFGFTDFKGTDIRAPLLQQPNGSFELSTVSLPASLDKYGIATSTSLDINHDGIADLIFGLSTMAKQQGGVQLSYDAIKETPTLAIAFGQKNVPISEWQFQFIGNHWIDENGYEKFIASYGLPSPQATAGANSLEVMDINDDGQLDIVVGSYITEGFSHRGGGFQVFINEGGVFTDQTSTYFPNQLANRDFGAPFNLLYSLTDINADGLKDFLVTTNAEAMWPEFAKFGSYKSIFIQQKDGTFLPADVNNMKVFDNSVVGAYGLNSILTGDFNGDGAPDLLSLKDERDFYWGSSTSTEGMGYAITTHLNKYATSYKSNEFIVLGTLGNDTLEAFGNKLKVLGLFGDDLIKSSSGNDTIDGGFGIDTVNFSQASSKFTLAATTNGWTLSDSSGADGMDSISNVERLQFTDRSVIIESQAHGSYADLPTELYQFFITAFNAAPGVTYMDQLAEAYRYGLSVKQIVDIFTTKKQFTDVYSPSLSHADMASQLVNNIVKNSATLAAKTEAITDIKGALDIGWTVGDVIYTVFGNLAHKSLNDTTWGNTARQFNNEIAVAKYYTEVLNQSTTDLETLRDVIQPVTQSTDVSSDVVVAQLIGVALMNGGTLP